MLFMARMIAAAAAVISKVPKTPYIHTPLSPVTGRSGPLVLTTVRGTTALTEPLFSIMVTGLPLTAAEAVRRAAPQISQNVSISVAVMTMEMESFRSV